MNLPMKTNLLNIALVAAITLSAAAIPAHADNHGWDRHDHDHGKRTVVKKKTTVRVNVVNGGGYRSPVYVAPRPVVVHRPVYVARPVTSVEFDVQRALAARGYYGGVIDGDIGPRSRAAIRTYQVDKGLPVTGLIDHPLLRSLRLL